MNIIDLTRTIRPGMPVFPGTEAPLLEQATTIEGDGFRETKITMYSHTGTHVDAPSHLIPEGPTLSDLSLDSFFGFGTVLELERYGPSLITKEDLLPYEAGISSSDFILLNVGWSRHWGTAKYFEPFPSLTPEAAEWLASFSPKGVGIDAISIDAVDSTAFPVHKILMTKNIIIIENLTNLAQLYAAAAGRPFTLSVLPLKIDRCDGSPVRAAAVVG